MGITTPTEKLPSYGKIRPNIIYKNTIKIVLQTKKNSENIFAVFCFVG
ncbi:MAG: hypothetical protein IKV38_03135 [Clostridia bacterium]|nr:hypothetical protein [Clostridia bacterium]